MDWTKGECITIIPSDIFSDFTKTKFSYSNRISSSTLPRICQKRILFNFVSPKLKEQARNCAKFCEGGEEKHIMSNTSIPVNFMKNVYVTQL